MNSFLKLNFAPAVTATAAEVISERPTVDASERKTALGAVSGKAVTVVGTTPLPEAVPLQPAGSAGATTPSKFSRLLESVIPVGNV